MGAALAGGRRGLGGVPRPRGRPVRAARPPAHLAAFIRTSTEHDLLDHPEWEAAAELLVDELQPDDDHSFDIVGVPDLVAEPPDIWTLAELTDTIAILRSLAEVCGLDAIDEVLIAPTGSPCCRSASWRSPGATARSSGTRSVPSSSTAGTRWSTRSTASSPPPRSTPRRWPWPRPRPPRSRRRARPRRRRRPAGGAAEEPRDEDLEFWDETGVDCLEITVGGRTGYTLRCYLGDDPVFLSTGGRIQIYTSPEELENYLTEAGDGPPPGRRSSVWPDIRTAVRDGEAAVLAGPENTYVAGRSGRTACSRVRRRSIAGSSTWRSSC